MLTEQLHATNLTMSSHERRRILAIDYGRRRIGLAKSDDLGIIASALTTIEITSAQQGVDQVAKYINEIQPYGIVIGYPLLASGDRSMMCDEIDRFLEKLAPVYSGPVYKVDESGSSKDAVGVIRSHGKKSGKRKAAIDRIAAVMILQRYLDEGPVK